MRTSALLPILIAALAGVSACSEAPAADRRESEARAQVAAASDSRPAIELTSIALRVPDMSCPLCARPIEYHLRQMGVRDAKADLQTKWVTGRFDPDRLTPEAIRGKIEQLRFRVTEVRVG